MTLQSKHRLLFAMISIVVATIECFSITIHEARSLAVERYPLIKDYNLIELTKEYTLDNASKAWLPQINIAIQATWQSDAPTYPDALAQMLEQKGLNINGMNRVQGKALIDVSQTIWDGGKIKASQEVVKCETQENLIANDIKLYQLYKSIDDLFFGKLLLDQQLQSLQGSITVLEANVDKVKTLVRNGVAMQCDADAIEAELLSFRQQLISVQCAAEAYSNILALYIGDRASEDLQIPDPLLVPNDNNAANRPENKLMIARQMTLKAKLSHINAMTMPRLSIFAQGYYGYPGMNFMSAMIKHKLSLNALVGLSFSWNISSLYSKRNEGHILQTACERIDVARDVFDFNVGVQATKERSELRRLYEISVADEEILALRKKVRMASEARLREGIVEPLDLLKSINDENNARIAANTHHIQYIRSTYALQNILNN